VGWDRRKAKVSAQKAVGRIHGEWERRIAIRAPEFLTDANRIGRAQQPAGFCENAEACRAVSSRKSRF
jgi:hypothetical protein